MSQYVACTKYDPCVCGHPRHLHNRGRECHFGETPLCQCSCEVFRLKKAEGEGI